MTRRSLRPHLNQIRTWVRQGRTDAWIAHQLEVTVQQIQVFKREQDLEADGDANGATEEVDLRATDDELIAAELEAEAARKAEEEARQAEEDARKAEEEAARAAERAAAGEDDAPADGDAEEKPKRRRASRSRSRKKTTGPLEGTFDHGEEGYGLWLDPAVEDDAVYAEHWAGHRPVTVTIEEDQIVIRRAGEEPSGDDS
jgi:hypothetical protein